MFLKKMQDIPLRYQIVSYILLLVTPILLILSVTNYFEFRRSLLSSYELLQIQTENNIANALTLVDHGYKLLEGALEIQLKKAFVPFLAAYETQGNDPAKIDLAALKQQLQAQLGLDLELYIISASGVIQYTTYQPDLGLDFKTELPQVYQALQTIIQGDRFVADRIIAEVRTGKLKKFVYLPTPDHRYILEFGVSSTEFNKLVGKFDPLKITEYLKTLNPSLEDIRMFDRLGTYVFGDADAHIKNETKALLSHMKAEGIKRHKVYDVDRDRFLSYIFINLKDENYVEDVSRFVEIAYNTRLIDAALWQQAIANTVISLMTIVLIVVVVFFISSRITQPILDLNKTAKRLALGQWPQGVTIQRQDEIGDLARSFNSMAIHLNELFNFLEERVAERTGELVETNKELKATLEHLRMAQEELVQSEKMAALGQLVAGIAHEINTPLGAIRSSVDNIMHSLTQTLEELPDFLHSLTPTQQQHFFVLLRSSPDTAITLKDKRRLKRQLAQQLTAHHIENTLVLADLLVDIGAQTQLTTLLPLLQDPKGRKILDTAYQLITLQRGVQTISVASERASKVVFALKNFTRYDQSGEKILAPVSEGIETVLTLYQNQLQYVEVVKHYDALPPLRCYPDALHQVWINLIHNALQAMNNKGTLTLEITQEADYAVVHIKDTGSGIPEEIQAKIFEPFFTTKPLGEGSGLGLDIVKKIVEKHGGEIKMISQLHQGSTFSVWLPMTDE